MKKFAIIIAVFFLLVFMEIMIMKMKEEFSLVRMLELGSIGLFLLLCYFIIRVEVRMASGIIEKRLRKVETEFRSIEERLRLEIVELRKLLKKK